MIIAYPLLKGLHQKKVFSQLRTNIWNTCLQYGTTCVSQVGLHYLLEGMPLSADQFINFVKAIMKGWKLYLLQREQNYKVNGHIRTILLQTQTLFYRFSNTIRRCFIANPGEVHKWMVRFHCKMHQDSFGLQCSSYEYLWEIDPGAVLSQFAYNLCYWRQQR